MHSQIQHKETVLVKKYRVCKLSLQGQGNSEALVGL